MRGKNVAHNFIRAPHQIKNGIKYQKYAAHIGPIIVIIN